jgi:hypothetical protein
MMVPLMKSDPDPLMFLVIWIIYLLMRQYSVRIQSMYIADVLLSSF